MMTLQLRVRSVCGAVAAYASARQCVFTRRACPPCVLRQYARTQRAKWRGK